MTDRKLVTIQKIESLSPIPGADRIELLRMEGLGWQCVVQKGLHEVGNLIVYHEIDSFVDPINISLYSWLDKDLCVFEGKTGHRVKTMTLRGQVSQGIVLPIKGEVDEWVDGMWFADFEDPPRSWQPKQGDDVTTLFKVVKWERELSADLQGVAAGNIPFYVKETDQERIQNRWDWIVNRRGMYPDEIWEVTEKLEGTSMSVWLNADGEFGVGGRKLNYIETDTNTFWKVVRRDQLEEKLRQVIDEAMSNGVKIPNAMALQGELIGPGIQGNYYKLKDHEFRLYDIWDIPNQRYIFSPMRYDITIEIEGLKHVPMVGVKSLNDFQTIEDFLAYADAPSVVNPQVPREGIVFKSKEFYDTSFKVVSNKYLLKSGN